MQINTRRDTGQGDVPLAVRTMKAGAVDFIEKLFASEAILSSLEAVLFRLTAPSEGGPVKAAADATLALLPSRELQVLQGLLAGLPSKSIDLRFRDQSAYRRDSPRAAHGQDGGAVFLS
jgi:FixJ family two-component response regulator